MCVCVCGGGDTSFKSAPSAAGWGSVRPRIMLGVNFAPSVGLKTTLATCSTSFTLVGLMEMTN